MPELPEVETIRRELEPLLVGRRVIGIKIGRPDIVGWPKPDEFERGIKGTTIVELGRRGKYLMVGLDAVAKRVHPPFSEAESGRRPHFACPLDQSGNTLRLPKPKAEGVPVLLIIHLRLSGHLEVRTSRTPSQRFERIRFNLSGGKSLIFIEPRVLGRVYLVDEDNLPAVLGGLKNMGLEPIDPAFDIAYLKDKVGHRTAAIKGLLLDQNITAGIGNIYSDEALFRAGIRPTRPANRITRREMERLTGTLREVLDDGIRHMGTTMSDSRYQRPNRMPGGFQKMLKVFDREGEPCRTCGTIIMSCKIGKRTTRYCPKCQK